MVAETLSVYYQNKEAAVISFDEQRQIGFFEYTPEFVALGLEIAPLMMPLKANKIYRFPNLKPETFKGLPGLVADSLPDRFGNSVLNQWLARIGRVKPITPIERLQYTGARGMGALEYRPSRRLQKLNASAAVVLSELTELAQEIVNERVNLSASIKRNTIDPEAMKSLLAVGTSAGGARAKAVLAFNQDFTQVRSGQVGVPKGFSHYIMKFDGVVENNQSEETFGDPLGYGVMEYVYYLMAVNAGIDMQPCHLIEDGKRRHFITKRFDRDNNRKIHMQTLTAMNHVDYNSPGCFSYEELFAIARRLKLPVHDAKQLFRRMVFNIVARNNDDHSKNFSFLFDSNRWRLSPAYDVAYCYKLGNLWVGQHWMSANQKRKNHTRQDLLAVGKNMTKLPVNELEEMIEQVIESVSQWSVLAKENDVPSRLVNEIFENLVYLPK